MSLLPVFGLPSGTLILFESDCAGADFRSNFWEMLAAGRLGVASDNAADVLPRVSGDGILLEGISMFKAKAVRLGVVNRGVAGKQT